MGRGTYGDDEHRVQAGAGFRVEGQDAGGDGDLLRLPEGVDAEAGDDDGSDADAARRALDGVEDEGAEGGHERDEPGHELVRDASCQGRDSDAGHADETKETDIEPENGSEHGRAWSFVYALTCYNYTKVRQVGM